MSRYFDFQDTLEYILKNIDLLSIIETYGLKPKKESDNRYVMLCPFHSEDTPSFKIFANENRYFCFGGCEGGNVVDFIKNYENISFTDIINRYKNNTPNSNGESLFKRIKENNNKEEFNLNEYTFSSKYRMGILLREYLKSNKDKRDFVDKCFYDMDIFFENVEALDKDKVNYFEKEILDRMNN